MRSSGAGPGVTPSVTRRPRTATRLTILIGILSSVLFSWLAVRGVDWDKAGAALTDVRWGWIAVYLAVATLIQGLRMIRWSWLLHGMGERRIGRSLSVGAVGLSAIFFLPARLGEAVRPVVIVERGGIGMGEAVATVVVERLVDGILIGLMLLLLGIGVEGEIANASSVRNTGLVVGGIFLGLTMAVALAATFADRSHGLIARLFGRWPRVTGSLTRAVDRFRDGIVAIARSGQALPYLGVTVLMWILSGLSIVPLFLAFGLDYPVSAAFVVLAAQAVGILVPAAPTSVGPFHFATMWALSLYGVAEPVAFNLAATNHLAQVVVNLAVGLGGIAAGGMSPSDLRRRVTAADAPTETAEGNG